MKILHIINSMDIGGAQKLLSELLPEINHNIEIDIEVLVFNLTGSKFEKTLIDSGIPVHSIDTSEKSIGAVFKIREWIKKYDIIHAHLFPTLYYVAIANIGIGKTLIYTEHSTSNKRRGKWYTWPLEYCIYSRYDKIIGISPQTIDNLNAWIGWDRESNHTIVIENGVSLNSFKLDAIDFKEEKIVLMVSRFTGAKDQKTLIRAIPFINKDLTIAFAGEGKTLEECKSLANSLNVSDRCLFLGNRDDVPKLMASSFVGVQSSHWEGFGLTAVEFMAMHKPVIASDVEGLRQIVEGAGIVFPHEDYQALAESINSLYKNQKLYSDTADKCLYRSKFYDVVQTAIRYYELYRATCKHII